MTAPRREDPGAARLDWRELAPEPRVHSCDCSYCDMNGGDEPIVWPALVVAAGDGIEYVTDRFLMVRADLAPVPAGYEGLVHPDRPNASSILASLAGITTEPPAGMWFRWSIGKALHLTGWDLRVLAGEPKGYGRVALVDRDGQPIGVAIASKRERLDEDDTDRTWTYGAWEAVDA